MADSAAPAVDDAVLRNGLSRAINMLTALSEPFVNGTPDDPARAKALQALSALGLAPPDTAQADDQEDEDVDSDGVPLSPQKRQAKRERRAWNAQFKNLDAQRVQKARENKPGLFPADMSTPAHRDAAISKTLGKFAPKKGR